MTTQPTAGQTVILISPTETIEFSADKNIIRWMRDGILIVERPIFGAEPVLFTALLAARRDSARLDIIKELTDQKGWRLTVIPGEYHEVQLKSGHLNGFDTIREALTTDREFIAHASARAEKGGS